MLNVQILQLLEKDDLMGKEKFHQIVDGDMTDSIKTTNLSRVEDRGTENTLRRNLDNRCNYREEQKTHYGGILTTGVITKSKSRGEDGCSPEICRTGCLSTQ